MKIAMFPIHQPYQTMIMNTDHDFYIVDGLWENTWFDNKNKVIGSVNRELPKNATIISMDEFWRMDMDEGLDIVLLQTAEHIVFFEKNIGYTLKTPIGFVWHTTFDLHPMIANVIGDRPIGFAASNNWDLREQDRSLPAGFDVNEYYKRGDDTVDKLLFPTNRYAIMKSNLYGWDWRDMVRRFKMRIVGNNPEFKKSYKDTEMLSFDEYKKALGSYMGVFQIGRQQHRTLTMGEILASGNVVVTQSSKQFKIQPSYLENNKNALIVSNKSDFVRYMYQKIFNDGEYYKHIGEQAVQDILKYSSLEQCSNNWNEFLELISNA